MELHVNHTPDEGEYFGARISTDLATLILEKYFHVFCSSFVDLLGKEISNAIKGTCSFFACLFVCFFLSFSGDTGAFALAQIIFDKMFDYELELPQSLLFLFARIITLSKHKDKHHLIISGFFFGFSCVFVSTNK